MARTYRHIYKWLRNGASRDANVNGSVTPVEFTYTCAEDSAEIERMILFIEDTGTFDADKYGNGVSLTNGIKVELKNSADAVLIDFLDGETVTANGEWQALCHDFLHNAIGIGNEVASVRWTWGKAGEPVVMESGDYICVTIQDDLTGLVHHWFQIQGVQR